MPDRVDSNKIRYRPATENDYEIIYNLSKENMEAEVVKHFGNWDDELFRKNFCTKTNTIIEYNQSFIGFFAWGNINNVGYIHNIQIKKEFQRNGIGCLVLAMIDKLAKRAGLKELRLRVFKDTPAEIFYSNNGYLDLEVKRGQVLMVKKITIQIKKAVLIA